MNNVGIIWQYGDYHDFSQTTESNKTTSENRISDIRQEEYPLLGRRVELMMVAAQIVLLDEPVNSTNRRRDLAAIIFEGSETLFLPKQSGKFPFLGEDKIGRSRLLQFIANSLENSSNVNNMAPVSYYDHAYIPNDPTTNCNNTVIPIDPNDNERRSSLNDYATDCSMVKKATIQVINYRCQFEQRFNEFGLLRALLKQLLQFHRNEKTQHEREQYLLRLFDISKATDLHLRRNLFLLNDLLDTNFRRSHIETENVNDQNLVKTYEMNINELLLHILNKLIEPPNNVGEAYQSIPLGNLTNKTW